MSPLAAWTNFYLLTGTSAAALTGLTFIAISLIGNTERRGTTALQAIAAYTSPTVVHFGAVVFLTALLSAPWPMLAPLAVLLGLAGLGGLGYTLLAVRRQRQQEAYNPVFEDWLWYAGAPLVSYGALVIAAFFLPGSPAATLYGIAAIMALHLFLGVRNAWDITTYVAITTVVGQDEGQ